MPTHLSDNDIDGYRSNTLTVDRLLDVDSHLAECSECRERASSPLNIQSIRLELSEPPSHIDYEQLEAYVDGNLNPVDREIVDAHLALCKTCSQEARELTALRAELSTYPARHYAPAAQQRLSDRIRSFVRIPRAWIPATTLSAAAASALLVFWFSSRPLQSRLAGNREEIARLNQSLNAIQRANNDLTRQTAALPDLQRQVRDLQSERERTRIELDQARRAPAQFAAVDLKDRAAGIARDSKGNLVRVEALPAGVAAALQSGRVRIPDRVAKLAGKEGVLMGGSNTFAVIVPRSTAILTDRPTFNWRTAEGATGYVVTVYDEAGKEIVRSPLIAGTRWISNRPLSRSKQYTWEVVAHSGEAEIAKAPAPPSPPARFLILEPSKAAAIENDRLRYADSPLILGIRYAEAGLLEDAVASLKTAIKRNPRSTPASKLLANIQARLNTQNPN